ncbi:hypothetical protein HU200_050880 [Digitaria exilis]|uniref:Uncharacterized protein n=1 Tax=Digitaria exilis TaxID=1010633 RepID=A0A835EAY2_9POAL|nr:hypothetical protein HU200_050880 [Digitaria exilis]
MHAQEDRSSFCTNINHHEPLRAHRVARDPVQLRLATARNDRLRPGAKAVAIAAGPTRVVGTPVGPHALHRRLLHRQVLLRHRQLRLRPARLRRPRSQASGHPRRVHLRRPWRLGLLRREPRRRLQPADARRAAAPWRWWAQLRADWVHDGPERRLPRRAAGGGRPRRWRRRGVQERVRGVRFGGALLPWGAREPQHVLADDLLAVLQEIVPASVQLRVRRRHLHFHLRRWRHVVHDHLLPNHSQHQVSGN